MKSERSIVKSKFMEVALEVIKEEREFLEEIGRLGTPRSTVARKAELKV